MSIFWEFHQWEDIEEAKNSASRAGRQVRKAERAVENLEKS